MCGWMQTKITAQIMRERLLDTRMSRMMRTKKYEREAEHLEEEEEDEEVI